MAEIIERLQGLFTSAETSLTSAGDYLPLLRGTINTNGAKGWKKVYFSKNFVGAPQVVIQGSPGISDYKPRKVVFAKVHIPDIDIPIVNVALPDIDLPDVSTFLINQINNTAWSNTGNPIIDLTSNITMGPIIAVLLIFAHYVGEAFDKFNDEYIEPMLNQIVAIIRQFRDKINNEIIGQSDNPKLGTINRALDDTRVQLESVINDISESFSASINHTVDFVFEFMGVIDKIPLAPTAVQNVTANSFEFYSAGGTYSWIAIGVFQ